jgi:hypothetical protein
LSVEREPSPRDALSGARLGPGLAPRLCRRAAGDRDLGATVDLWGPRWCGRRPHAHPFARRQARGDVFLSTAVSPADFLLPD